MKQYLTIISLFFFVSIFAQRKESIIKNDSLPCCRTIYGIYNEKEIPNTFGGYVFSMEANTVTGYPLFDIAVGFRTSKRGKWYDLMVLSLDSTDFIDGGIDTAYIEDTPFPFPAIIGVRVTTHGSTQAIDIKADLNLIPYK